MADKDSIFSEGTTTSHEEKDYVAQAKKKFTKEDDTLDIEGLLNGKAESDKFIDQLLREKQEMRKDLDSRITMEDALSKLYERSTSNRSVTTTEERLPDNDVTTQVTTPTMGKEEILNMVREALVSESSKAKKQTNLAEARNILEQEFGNNFVMHLDKKAQELGVNREFLDKLAQESPKALVALVKDSNTPSPQGLATPPTSSVNVSQGSGGTRRNFKYYENLRKTDSRAYWSGTVQAQMYKDASSLGPDFYSN